MHPLIRVWTHVWFGIAIALSLLWFTSSSGEGLRYLWGGVLALIIRQVPLAIWTYRAARKTEHKTRLMALVEALAGFEFPYYANSYFQDHTQKSAQERRADADDPTISS